jgi:hypothetical protein
MKTKIHTALVGRQARVMTADEMLRHWPGGHGRFRAEYAGQTGQIVNVYLTADGVTYDLLFADGSIWVDCWSGFFRVETA